MTDNSCFADAGTKQILVFSHRVVGSYIVQQQVAGELAKSSTCSSCQNSNPSWVPTQESPHGRVCRVATTGLGSKCGEQVRGLQTGRPSVSPAQLSRKPRQGCRAGSSPGLTGQGHRGPAPWSLGGPSQSSEARVDRVRWVSPSAVEPHGPGGPAPPCGAGVTNECGPGVHEPAPLSQVEGTPGSSCFRAPRIRLRPAPARTTAPHGLPGSPGCLVLGPEVPCVMILA